MTDEIVLDIRLVRENPDAVREDLSKRGAADKARLLEDVFRKESVLTTPSPA